MLRGLLTSVFVVAFQEVVQSCELRNECCGVRVRCTHHKLFYTEVSAFVHVLISFDLTVIDFFRCD
jgi:hypothetical protein